VINDGLRHAVWLVGIKLVHFGEKTLVQAVAFGKGSSKLVTVAMLNIDPSGTGQVIENILAEFKLTNASSVGSPLNVFVDGVLTLANVPFAGVSNYEKVIAGSRTISIQSSATPGANLLTLVPNLAPATDTSIVVSGPAGALQGLVLTDNNPATTDPLVVAMDFSDPCGNTQITAHNTFAVDLNAPLAGSTTFTVTLFPAPGEIKDRSLNNLPNPSSTTFNTGAPDFTPPTLTDTRVVNNIASTDFSDVGDAFSVTFSEKMNGNVFGLIPMIDPDGSTATVSCGNNSSCIWNVATTTLTVTLTQPLANSGGTVPGLQLPATISGLIGITDQAGNAPDMPGSADRVIDVE